jgi:hypothetical protein
MAEDDQNIEEAEGPVWAQVPPPGARLPGVPATYPAPDEWDAIALTFAEPVKEPRQRTPRLPPRPRVIEPSGDPSRAWLAI